MWLGGRPTPTARLPGRGSPSAVAGVADQDAGIASATYDRFFQIGGAIGLAALTTVASTAIRNDLTRVH